MDDIAGHSAAPRGAAAISRALRDAREYTLSIYADLSEAERAFPRLDVVNPPAWELGHIGWFQEFWCLRHSSGLAPRIADADAWWDSSRVPHATRWSLPLPDWPGIHAYLEATLDATLAALSRRDGGELYPFELALYHEDMHGEALVMSLQTLGLPAPSRSRERTAHTDARGDLLHGGGTLVMGATRGDERDRFVFDNEKWAHEVRVAPFAIARSPVTAGEFLAFVDDGGYVRPELWSGAAAEWRQHAGRTAPAYWRRAERGWEQRVFDRWRPLDVDAAVTHVNAFEAQAWCDWAHRRLPSEAEWELAAMEGRFALPGAAWEWTASAFAPYPGFAPDRYADYSAPWFGTHRVLRGGSWATRARLVHARFRNFYEPHRHDPIAGFRSCAI